MNSLLLSLAALSTAALLTVSAQQKHDDAFSSTTIDIGMVVSDIEASAKFYGGTLGFQEVPGFAVPADFCTDAGLTDNLPLTIRVFKLGEGDNATKLKLMQIEGAKPKSGDNSFIHSQLGLSYLTVYISDTTYVLAHLADAKIDVLGQGPVAIGTGDKVPYLTVVRDPDGNLIELIGPKL
ncbi:MAG: lactoylglutathione lyase [Planctomycetota bacterium]|jgi:lactoylglutathione lyase